jgi:hypothetical protein
MEETDMVELPTDTKGLGTDPSQKQSLLLLNTIYILVFNFIISAFTEVK